MEPNFWLFLIIGAAAQLVDGMLGMGFGTFSSSLCLSLGLPPKVTSNLIHTAQIFTAGAGGFSHWKLGNFDKRITVLLAIYGSLGGIIGSLALTKLQTPWLKIAVAAYLLFLGMAIIHKYWRLRHREPSMFETFPLRLVARLLNVLRLRVPAQSEPISKVKLATLGLGGGTLDAIGGGGWGAIVNSSLITKHQDPHKSVGSTCIAEFFMTLAISITLFSTLETVPWGPLLGLVCGGVIMAPISAYLCTKINSRLFLLLIGILISLLSAQVLVQSSLTFFWQTDVL